MDPNASNYDSKATVDSGFCTYTKPKAPTLGVSFVNCTPAANGQMTYAVTLAWTDNSNNETGFAIERSTNNKLWTQIAAPPAAGTGSTVTFTDTGLRKRTKYYYRVRAYNSGGNSAYSVAGPVTTP